MRTYWASFAKLSITNGNAQTVPKALLGFTSSLRTTKQQHKSLCNDKNVHNYKTPWKKNMYIKCITAL